MVVEKLIPKTGKCEFPEIIFEWGGQYRYGNCPRTFHIQYEYWYDGRLFLLGYFDNRLIPSLVEVETGAYVVGEWEFKKYPGVKQIIKKFKENLQNHGGNIHESVRDFKCKNLDVETWLISSLGI